MANNTEKRITAKMVLDSTGFNNGLKGVNSSLKNAQSEMKLASQGIKSFGADSNKLKSVQESLTKQIELHSKKVDVYRQSMEKAKTKMQDNIRKRDELKTSLDSANRKYDEAVRIYGRESTEARKAKEEVDRLKSEHEKASKAVETNAKQVQNHERNMNNANTAMVRTQGELRRTNEELARNNNKWLQASENLQRHSEKLKSMGGKITNVGKNLTTHVSLPLAGIGIAASKVGMDFEAEMSKVQAISGATGEDFKKLKAKAEEMGAKTKFSATESAEGLEYMAMAGWKTQDMLDGLPPILNLAIASGEELGSTSDIVTDALTAFGLKAKDAGMFSDVLAAASSNANTNVGMMGATFQYAAPVAGALGYSVQDTAIAIGLMANAGIKADKAGTAIRTGLTNLVKPTDNMADAMDKYGISVEDTHGKMKPFRQLIVELREKLGKLDKATQANVVSTIFGKEAMSGWLSVINASPADVDKLTKAIDTSQGATDKMAATMSNNAKGSITEMKSALEGAGIKIFEVVAPSITSLAKEVSKMADKFSKLNPKTQETIVKMGALAIAGGPIIGGIGRITTGIGGLVGLVGKAAGGIGKLTLATRGASVAAAGASAATTTATTATTGLGLAAKLGPALLSPYTLAIAGVGIAAVGLHQHMKQEAIPAVNLFADGVKKTTTTVKTANGQIMQSYGETTVKISEETKKQVGAYMELDKGVTESLTSMYANRTKITQENSQKLQETYTQMNEQIKSGIDKHHQDRLTNLNKFFDDNMALTDKEKAEILSKENAHNEQMKASNQEYTDKIKAILDRASKENRQLKKEEVQDITMYQNQMKENAVKALSKQEVESKLILERLKSSNTRITAESASNAIQNAEKQRRETISAAEKQYDDTVRNIIRMRDETGSITKEQADKMIKEAERQKKQTIDIADMQKQGVVSRIKEMNSDVMKDIDETDGHIMSKWDKLKNWFLNNPIVRWIKTKTSGGDGEADSNWTGNNYFRGGLTYLHDAPGRNSNYELYDLPRGTRIYNHDASQELVLKTAESVATKVANSVLSDFNGGNGGINVTQNIYSETPSPAEIARQTKNSLRELALNW
ncbi:phage tail tape measure protein [Clostridium sp. MB40-C1]|uniref:phage tail tape measure protein n=1 Tax=Clostridium sp. MB40-C1 TaxID=3070996 RepID=UPI0027E1AC59|nr:phage tail tape measure protein [Clostridium sp. MB40-C1]WMJ81976.1 phage tail tape measure protein [Clostridium sp. MB40-C1]